MKTNTFFLFVGEQCGQLEEAINFYVSVFDNSSILNIEYYTPEDSPEDQGFIKRALFTINGQEYMASESSLQHDFTFTPAMSIFVDCDDVYQIEKFYELLSENGQILMPIDNYGYSSRFAWVADKYGISWQLNLA